MLPAFLKYKGIAIKGFLVYPISLLWENWDECATKFLENDDLFRSANDSLFHVRRV